MFDCIKQTSSTSLRPLPIRLVRIKQCVVDANQVIAVAPNPNEHWSAQSWCILLADGRSVLCSGHELSAQLILDMLREAISGPTADPMP
jgi:hypothetical protein